MNIYMAFHTDPAVPVTDMYSLQVMHVRLSEVLRLIPKVPNLSIQVYAVQMGYLYPTKRLVLDTQQQNHIQAFEYCQKLKATNNQTESHCQFIMEHGYAAHQQKQRVKIEAAKQRKLQQTESAKDYTQFWFVGETDARKLRQIKGFEKITKASEADIHFQQLVTETEMPEYKPRLSHWKYRQCSALRHTGYPYEFAHGFDVFFDEMETQAAVKRIKFGVFFLHDGTVGGREDAMRLYTEAKTFYKVKGIDCFVCEGSYYPIIIFQAPQPKKVSK